MNFATAKSFLFHNQTLKQTLLKNSFWLVLAEAIDSGIGFLIIVWLARNFGPEHYGQWAFALSFVSFFVILADFGLSVLVVREVARDKNRAPEYIDNILAIKMVFGLITLALIALAIQFFGKSPMEKTLVYFLGLYTVINTFGAFFHAIFKAYEKMQYETLTRIIQSVSLLALCSFFILAGKAIIFVSYAYLISAMVGVLVSLVFVWHYFSKFFLKLDWQVCKRIFQESWSIGLSSLTVVVLYYFAPVVLGMVKSSKEVALYNIAFNTSFLIGPLSTILFSSFLPGLSRAFHSDKKELHELCGRALQTYFFFVFPYAIGGLIIATQLISFLYTWSYIGAVMPFQMLVLGNAIGFISSAFSGFLLAFDKQKSLFFFTLVGAVVNIILNIIFIPWQGVLGATIVYFLSATIVFILIYHEVNKVMVSKIFWASMTRPLISSLVMAGFLLVFLRYKIYNPIYLVILGALIYFISFLSLLSMKKFLKKIYKKILPNFEYHFKKDLADCQSILDLGCGPNSPVKDASASMKVGVELFGESLEESKKRGIHQQYIQEDILKVNFEPKSFDAIVMVDVIEHIKKEDAIVLIKKMETWARKKIILLTPQGFVHQEDHHNPLQNHLSGWEVEDFEKLGFKVYGINGWKALRGEHAYLKFKPTLLWIIISDITQQLVYRKPKQAFHLYAIKELP